MFVHTGESSREGLPGGGAEGQGPDAVVVSEKTSVGQQTERAVRLPHSQQSRLCGQIPEADDTWRRRAAVNVRAAVNGRIEADRLRGRLVPS